MTRTAEHRLTIWVGIVGAILVIVLPIYLTLTVAPFLWWTPIVCVPFAVWLLRGAWQEWREWQGQRGRGVVLEFRR